MTKPNLAAAFKAAEAETTKPTTQKKVSKPRVPKPATDTQGVGWATRNGKKTLITYIDPAALRELKILAATTEKTQQELVIEALNDLFIKHGKKPIA